MSESGAALRVLLVDDEELARLRLRSPIAECAAPRAVVAGEAANADAALAWLGANACDLVLLDIRMPGRDGMALAAQLQRRAPAPAVVFVTAHAEHALQAFELDAADYLTKPVRRERLQAALQRAAQRLVPRQSAETEGDDAALVVSELGRIVRVPVREVLYLKAELKYVTLRTAERSYVLDDALADLQQRLGERFLRVHRNALVARHAMRALERRAPHEDEGGDAWAVRVAPVDEWLTVSRRQVAAVREAMLAERAR